MGNQLNEIRRIREERLNRGECASEIVVIDAPRRLRPAKENEVTEGLGRRPAFLSVPRMTILSASSGNGRCSALASSHGACIQTSRSSAVVRITGIAFGSLRSRGACLDERSPAGPRKSFCLQRFHAGFRDWREAERRCGIGLRKTLFSSGLLHCVSRGNQWLLTLIRSPAKPPPRPC
jgi:hypothetical protein